MDEYADEQQGMKKKIHFLFNLKQIAKMLPIIQLIPISRAQTLDFLLSS